MKFTFLGFFQSFFEFLNLGAFSFKGFLEFLAVVGQLVVLLFQSLVLSFRSAGVGTERVIEKNVLLGQG